MDHLLRSCFHFMNLIFHGVIFLFLLDASKAEVCYIHQSVVRRGLVKWVAPPDPCSCSETRIGGVNTMGEPTPPNGYLDDILFTRDKETLRAWFGCPSIEAPTSTPGDLTDCKDVLMSGYNSSGLYTIYPHGTNPGVTVYCDMDTDGGGWTVFQRRQDGSENFYRDWTIYRNGFGNMSGEFWLGNNNLRRLTETGDWELRVDLLDWSGTHAYTKYGSFRVYGDEYTLEVADKKPGGGAGDSFTSHSGQGFSTLDRDNDGYDAGSCATSYQGGWWYFPSCILSHLNGPYEDYDTAITGDGKGIVWTTFGYLDSLKGSEMKIRKIV